MASIDIRQISKRFPGGVVAVDELSLEIDDGQFVVLVGPSGCGKTTALRMVAGLEEITAGTIRIGDQVVNHIDPRQRDIAMVFQNYALYPQMTVQENIGFPLRIAGVSRRERDEKVGRVAKTLGLESHLKRKPRQLSGGQRQRVAMGRAIIREPQAFLMDEPLSNLDAKLRVQMRAEISSLQRAIGVTTLYVTHDQIEAMTMGDRVVVMRNGQVQQFGAPQEVYDHPANLFVAGFIGNPPMNLIEGEFSASDGGYAVTIGSANVRLDEQELAGVERLRAYAGRKLIVGIRPERLEDAALVPDVPSHRRVRGGVHIREALGSDVLVHFTVEASGGLLDRTAYMLAHGIEDLTELEELERSERGVMFVGRFAPQTRVPEAGFVETALRPGALQFFDPETGIAIG